MAFADPIPIFRGTDVTVKLTMEPVEDITGWTIEFTVEGSPNSPKLIQKQAVITNPTQGLFEVDLTAMETDLRVGRYQYDAFRIDSGSSRRLAGGDLIVQDVARLPA